VTRDAAAAAAPPPPRCPRHQRCGHRRTAGPPPAAGGRRLCARTGCNRLHQRALSSRHGVRAGGRACVRGSGVVLRHLRGMPTVGALALWVSAEESDEAA
jgi:hypothetical protein